MNAIRIGTAISFVCIAVSHLVAAENSSTGSELPGKAQQPKSFQIQNQKYGDLLRPQEASHRDGAPIVLYPAQRWRCLTWKLIPDDGSEYRIQNHYTSKTFVAATAANSHAVVQAALPTEAKKAIQWRFIKLKDGTYRIVEPKSGQVLTAVKGVDTDEVHIELLPWQEKEEQKWKLLPIDPETLIG